MKYLLGLINKNKDYLIILILSFFLSASYIVDICSGYLNYYNFDLQEFLLWHYTSLSGSFPYKDIFYPYGLLNYFKYYNLALTFIYYLIIPLLFTFIYFIFKKVFKDKLSLFFSFIFFYVFVLIIVGFPAFARYGLLVVISLIFSCIFYSNTKSTKIKTFTLFVCGMILGLFFTVINDQGAYLVLYFISLFIFSKLLQARKINFLLQNFFIQTIEQSIAVLFGFFISMIPVFLILQHFGSFYSFFTYFKDVIDIVMVAKTPFFSFIDSPANIFTVSILFFAIFYNFIKLFFFKHKFTFSSFLQTSLIITILIMEQKSIIRSIDRQITFVSLILLMFIAYELTNMLINKNQNRKIIYIIIITVATLVYGFNVERPINNFSYLFNSYELLTRNRCFDNNLKFFSTNNPSYAKIINLLRKQKGFNNKVFSFSTGDSAFYVLLNQKPPYYNAIFEGASYGNQNLAIKYMRDNEIEYVTLNTSKLSVQDTVPDYIRQGFLFKYILNNYQPFAVIGDHIILKKAQNNDFFASKILEQVEDYKNYLLDVYLYKIPHSEGLYKYNYLKNNNKIIIEGSIDKINSFLKKNNLSSSSKIIVLNSSTVNKSGSLIFIEFETKNGNSTTVYFNPCNKNEVCIINLSRIPFFYKERLVEKIIADKEYKGEIRIFDLKNSGNLW